MIFLFVSRPNVLVPIPQTILDVFLAFLVSWFKWLKYLNSFTTSLYLLNIINFVFFAFIQIFSFPYIFPSYSSFLSFFFRPLVWLPAYALSPRSGKSFALSFIIHYFTRPLSDLFPSIYPCFIWYPVHSRCFASFRQSTCLATSSLLTASFLLIGHTKLLFLIVPSFASGNSTKCFLHCWILISFLTDVFFSFFLY